MAGDFATPLAGLPDTRWQMPSQGILDPGGIVDYLFGPAAQARRRQIEEEKRLQAATGSSTPQGAQAITSRRQQEDEAAWRGDTSARGWETSRVAGLGVDAENRRTGVYENQSKETARANAAKEKTGKDAGHANQLLAAQRGMGFLPAGTDPDIAKLLLGEDAARPAQESLDRYRQGELDTRNEANRIEASKTPKVPNVDPTMSMSNETLAREVLSEDMAMHLQGAQGDPKKAIESHTAFRSKAGLDIPASELIHAAKINAPDFQERVTKYRQLRDEAIKRQKEGAGGGGGGEGSPKPTRPVSPATQINATRDRQYNDKETGALADRVFWDKKTGERLSTPSSMDTLPQKFMEGNLPFGIGLLPGGAAARALSQIVAPATSISEAQPELNGKLLEALRKFMLGD